MTTTTNQFSLPGRASENQFAALKTACASTLLPLLLVLALPASVQAQFYYAITNGTVTITGYYGSGGAVTIPNTISGLQVISIGDRAFYEDYVGAANLTSITIPNSVTTIGDNAFYYCSDLTNVEIGTNVISIGDGAFAACASLTTITIPNSVISIGDGAFAGCFLLANATIGNSVTSIGDDAFEDCTSLSSLMIGSKVTSIGEYSFEACAMTSVSIPNTVTTIGDYAFEFCSSLLSATIGTGVTNIGVNAFYTCENLTGVYFKGNAPSAIPPLFNGDDNVTIYYLPGTTGWGSPFAEGLPPVLWFLPNPLILNGDSFGVQNNQFGFIISWATNIPVVVEACTNLDNPIWSPVSTNTLTAGSSYFSDPQWTNSPSRFYRLCSP